MFQISLDKAREIAYDNNIKTNDKGVITMPTDQYEETISQLPDDILLQIATRPKKQYTQQEIDEARGKLVLMNDRVFWATFSDNKRIYVVYSKQKLRITRRSFACKPLQTKPHWICPKK